MLGPNEMLEPSVEQQKEKIQTFSFSNDYESHMGEYKLLQVPSEVLNQLLDENVQNFTLVIKGNENDTAVLCTEDKTYSLTRIETSNSLLLTRSTNDKQGTIETCLNCYYEANRIPCQIQQLHSLLCTYPPSTTPISNSNSSPSTPSTPGIPITPITPSSNGKDMYTLEMLENNLIASRQEILNALKELNAIEIDGIWCVLDAIYLEENTDIILNLIIEKSWPVNSIPEHQFVDILLKDHEIEPFISKHWLSCFCSANASPSSSTSEQSSNNSILHSLNFEKIAFFIARRLFEKQHKWKFSQFKQAWVEKLLIDTESQLTIDLIRKAGICIIEENTPTTGEHEVTYFDRHKLSIDPKKRFKQLFRAKKKWKYEEISPYLQDLTSPSVTIDYLLSRHTRSNQTFSTSQKYYFSR